MDRSAILDYLTALEPEELVELLRETVAGPPPAVPPAPVAEVAGAATEEDGHRQIARALFGPRPATEPAPPAPGNHVASEGGNSTPVPSNDAQLREFTRELFTPTF